MKKKRKFNPEKFIKTWSVIAVVVVILIVVIQINKKENKVIQGKNKEVASTDVIENNTIMEPIQEQPEIGSKTTDWNLILVNKDNKVPESYQCELAIVEGNQKVDKRILEALTQMLADARKEGLKPIICSSYRATDTQITLFNRKVNEYKAMGYKERRGRRKSILLGNESTNQ